VSARKHVALDLDVHLKLAKQRRRSGLTIKAIVNNALRCALSDGQLLRDSIGEVLTDRGYLTEEEYVEIVEQACRSARSHASPDHEAFERLADGTYCSGSWTIRPTHASADDAYETVEASARDARRRSTHSHVHEVSESVLVLSGHVAAHIEDRIRLLDSLDSICIPEGIAHSLTPLTPDTVLSITFVPSSGVFQLDGTL